MRIMLFCIVNAAHETTVLLDLWNLGRSLFSYSHYITSETYKKYYFVPTFPQSTPTVENTVSSGPYEAIEYVHQLFKQQTPHPVQNVRYITMYRSVSMSYFAAKFYVLF